jgi:predicted RNA-binding Zn-ribbon protein involved in translation (DUF1610 family)
MGLKLNCPECNSRFAFDLENTQFYCPECGYTPSTGVDERAAEVRAKGKRPEVRITNESAVNPRALSLFHTAHDYLFAENREAAIASLHDALEVQSDFDQAHLWIAKISNDETVQREHLSEILAHEPNHPEARRMMMVLNGQLTPAMAAVADDPYRIPELKIASEPVSAKGRILRCPQCGGDLTADERNGQVHCAFCGYHAHMPRPLSSSGDDLFVRLLERRGQSTQWLVGARVLHCNNCGAERTLGAQQLSSRCGFCNSNQVIEQDALHSLEQPDALLPFQITREDAGQRIKAQLRSASERLKGLWDTNRVASATLNGYYVPFWVFDAIVEVRRTRIDHAPSGDRFTPIATRIAAAHQVSTFQDMVDDLEICAVKSPPPTLMRKISDYDTSALVNYDPALLATYPAQTYTMSFDAAALDARSVIANYMRHKHTQRTFGEHDQVTIQVFSTVQQMQFRLALLPVWIANLTEVDADHRLALVNGQTGRVVLGASSKPTD